VWKQRCCGCEILQSLRERSFRSLGGSAAAPPAAIGPAQTSGMAIASLAFGVFLFAFPLSIVAIVLGHLSLSQIRKSAGRLKGEGIAIAGLVLGYLGVAALPVILIIAAIAIPNVLRARISANEGMAVSSLRTLATAEVAYVGSHPDRGYTCALSDLAGAGLIDPPLTTGRKYGYTFELSECTGSPDGGPNLKYKMVAYPVTRNQSGVRAFCSDESGAIKIDPKGSPQDCLANGSAFE
jgi:hypothetical protein